MTASSTGTMPRMAREARRLGYSIAAAANIVMIWVVHNILGWDVFGWLTAEFDLLLPWLTVSFVIGALLNLIYVAEDSVPIKSPGQILSSVVGLVVTVRTLAVFPFDFTGYGFDYTIPIRIALWVSIVGILFGIGSEVSKLAKYEGPSES